MMLRATWLWLTTRVPPQAPPRRVTVIAFWAIVLVFWVLLPGTAPAHGLVLALDWAAGIAAVVLGGLAYAAFVWPSPLRKGGRG
jgi:hypothetical protein